MATSGDFTLAIDTRAFPDHRIIAVAHEGTVVVMPDGTIREVHHGVTRSVLWESGRTTPIDD